MQKVKTVDEYMNNFPFEIQDKLQTVRGTIKKTAPEAEERISYQLPAYFENGILVYFGAFKNHIGFFPTGEGIKEFKKEIRSYKTSKGTIQFPLDKPLPLDLISKIVKHRVEINSKRR